MKSSRRSTTLKQYNGEYMKAQEQTHQDYKKRYEKIAQSKAFKEAYSGKSLRSDDNMPVTTLEEMRTTLEAAIKKEFLDKAVEFFDNRLYGKPKKPIIEDFVKFMSGPNEERMLLTDEILENNFPDYEEGYTIGWWPNEDNGTYCIEFTDDNHEVNLKDVKYVDELKAILKLCKLDKQIKL